MFHSVLVCGLVGIHRPQIVVVYTVNKSAARLTFLTILANFDVDLEERQLVVDPFFLIQHM